MKMAEENKVIENNKEQQQKEEPTKKKEGKKELKKHLVDSSNIEWVSYDEEKEDLYIGFRNNTTYVYNKVPKDIFDGLLHAGSKGRYFWMKIRNKPFEYKRIK